MPRLKAIQSQKLYRPEPGMADAYPILQPVLTRPINWDLIRQQCDLSDKRWPAKGINTPLLYATATTNKTEYNKWAELFGLFDYFFESHSSDGQITAMIDTFLEEDDRFATVEQVIRWNHRAVSKSLQMTIEGPICCRLGLAPSSLQLLDGRKRMAYGIA